MLILSRRKDEQIIIGGEIVIQVIEIKGNIVRLGVMAPSECSVNRAEVEEAKKLHPRTLD